MKKWIALCLVIGLMMGLCACGGRPPQENDVGVVSTTTTTATQGSTPSVDATTGENFADTAGSSAATTAVEGDTTAPVGTTTTRTDSPTTTVPLSHPSVTTTTATATTTTTATKPSLPQGDLIGKSLSVGDRMYDFTVTDSDGNTLTLSQMLQAKEMVVLNFWYINCRFCVKEFPAMSAAYEAYKDRVGMVALNPYDTVANISRFRADNASLTFPMASCPSGWVQTFDLQGFPTTVVIDREGIIREMHVGALLKVSDWEALFRPYLAH